MSDDSIDPYDVDPVAESRTFDPEKWPGREPGEMRRDYGCRRHFEDGLKVLENAHKPPPDPRRVGREFADNIAATRQLAGTMALEALRRMRDSGDLNWLSVERLEQYLDKGSTVVRDFLIREIVPKVSRSAGPADGGL